MKGNGQLISADQAMKDGSLLPCDFCGVPMDFATYQTHQCDGLHGYNPLQEKLKRAVWHKPGGGTFKGDLKAIGSIVRPNIFVRLWRKLRLYCDDWADG